MRRPHNAATLSPQTLDPASLVEAIPAPALLGEVLSLPCVGATLIPTFGA